FKKFERKLHTREAQPVLMGRTRLSEGTESPYGHLATNQSDLWGTRQSLQTTLVQSARGSWAAPMKRWGTYGAPAPGRWFKEFGEWPPIVSLISTVMMHKVKHKKSLR
ncbi:MAG: hypothetical protein JAY74_15015, partial [Candidatus Thiodiazotropha taylori]|nr:hypothetical protein [Candidatus Thiodiazotropha taylori]